MRPSAGPRNDDPALGLLRVIRDDGSTDPVKDPFLPPETLLAMHRDMLRSRLVDAAMIALQRQGRIASYNAGDGQEAVAIGATHALEATDWIFPAFRENAALLARGFPLDRFLAQLFGSAADRQKGRQAPGYVGSRAHCVASTSSSVGTQVPHAVGMAWAARRDGARRAVLAFVGEGGTSSADFHAALNFAGVFRAPCLVVVQNNQWAISTPAARQTAASSFAVKGTAYGVPAVRVDGSDVLAVYRAVADARVRAVAGAGPTLLECVTARRRLSSPPPSGEPASDGVPEAAASRFPTALGDEARDPLLCLSTHLSYLGLLDDDGEGRLRAEIAEEIARAVEAAEGLTAPDRATLFDDVYATRPRHLEEQAATLRRG